MSEPYVLLVCEKKRGFIENSIREALIDAGIEVRDASIEDGNITDYVEGAFGLFLVDIFENTFALKALKSKCYEHNKKVIVYGNENELDAMKRVFVDSMIFAELLRPLELQIIINQILKLRNIVKNQSITKKILVVDDNGLFLRTMMGWLEDKYEVSLANSPASASSSIQKSVPDLILLDYEMPVCNGAKFMELLSRTEGTKNIPVIFLTSRSDEETVKEVMELKPKGYILKTTPKEQLLSKIQDFFAGMDENNM